MSESPTDAEQPDTIDLGNPEQLRYWTERLGVTEEQLRQAMQGAGNSGRAVTQHLLNQGGSAGAS